LLPLLTLALRQVNASAAFPAHSTHVFPSESSSTASGRCLAFAQSTRRQRQLSGRQRLSKPPSLLRIILARARPPGQKPKRYGDQDLTAILVDHVLDHQRIDYPIPKRGVVDGEVTKRLTKLWINLKTTFDLPGGIEDPADQIRDRDTSNHLGKR